MKQNFIIVNMSIGGDVNSRNGIQIQMTYTERIIQLLVTEHLL